MQILDLEIVHGDTWEKSVYFTDNGVVIDITGWTIFFTVKENLSDLDSSAKIKKTTVVPAGADALIGKTTISLTPTDTTIPVKSYYYDIQIKSDTGTVLTIVTGILRILSDVTTRTEVESGD